jgi:hypothetical protein
MPVIPGTEYLLRFELRLTGIPFPELDFQRTKTTTQDILHLSLGKTWSDLFLCTGFLCDEYRMATTLAWTGPYRAQLDIKPGFFKPLREYLTHPGRPDCNYTLGLEFLVYAR